MRLIERILLALVLLALYFVLFGRSAVSAGSANASGSGPAYTVSMLPKLQCPDLGWWPCTYLIHPTGINNSGQVVGFQCDPSGIYGPLHYPAICQPFIASASSFDLIPLPAGFITGYALSINNVGQIVGYAFPQSPYENGAAPSQAFIGGIGGSAAVPGAREAYDINDLGQICGPGPFIGTASGVTVVPVLLCPPFWCSSQPDVEAGALTINNRGQIAGTVMSGGRHIFFGDITGIRNQLGGSWWPEYGPDLTMVFGRVIKMNDLGQVVGQGYGVGAGVRTFLTDRTGSIQIPDPTDCQCGPTGCYSDNPSLNNLGQVVTTFSGCGGVIWDAANGTRRLTDLVPPGWFIQEADAISHNGQIVAVAFNAEAQFYGFVILRDATPPVIAPQIGGVLGSNGWRRSSVDVSWNVTDQESGISSSTGCAVTTLSAETSGVTLTCSATNGVGLSSSVPAVIKIDKTAPVISGMPATGCTLWPPNQKLVTVATVSATDALSGLAAGSFTVTATSNEPIAPNDPKSPDIVITPTGAGGYTVQLRADRLGAASDRIYTITATAQDQAGNVQTNAATCTVPHDRGN